VPSGDVLLQIASTKGEVTVRAFLAILSLLAQDVLPPPCVIVAAFLIHLIAVLSVAQPSLLVDLLPVGFVPSFVVHGGFLYTITTFSFVVLRLYLDLLIRSRVPITKAHLTLHGPRGYAMVLIRLKDAIPTTLQVKLDFLTLKQVGIQLHGVTAIGLCCFRLYALGRNAFETDVERLVPFIIT